MDEKTQGTRPPPSGPGSADPREELRAQLQLMGKAAGDLLEQLVKVPATLAQIPLQVLPEDTATHARNAATEGFAAVRTLLDSMAHGIDEVMQSQRDRMAASGSTHTGVGDPRAPGSPAAGSDPSHLGASGVDLSAPHDLDPGATSFLGGHGVGGPEGNGTGSHNTVRLDEEP